MELVLDSVRKTFGGVVAVDDVSAVMPQDQVTALIGPNGAGKTTLFNAITGFDPPDQGAITFGGQRIDGLAPWRVAEMGLIRTFQTPVGFTTLTVRESMLAAATPHYLENPVQALGLSRRARGHERQAAARAEEITDELGLSDLLDVRTDELSAGDRKLLEFAALADGRAQDAPAGRARRRRGGARQHRTTVAARAAGSATSVAWAA